MLGVPDCDQRIFHVAAECHNLTESGVEERNRLGELGKAVSLTGKPTAKDRGGLESAKLFLLEIQANHPEKALERGLSSSMTKILDRINLREEHFILAQGFDPSWWGGGARGKHGRVVPSLAAAAYGECSC